MRDNYINDNELMLEGVSQLLGFQPYTSVEISDICDHIDDGYDYGETSRTLTLHCDKCGEFYEQDKR